MIAADPVIPEPGSPARFRTPWSKAEGNKGNSFNLVSARVHAHVLQARAVLGRRERIDQVQWMVRPAQARQYPVHFEVDPQHASHGGRLKVSQVTELLRREVGCQVQKTGLAGLVGRGRGVTGLA